MGRKKVIKLGPELLKQADAKNARNIMRKLRAGKTLTAAERNFLAGQGTPHATNEREINRLREKGHTAERAEFWGCRLRTMQLMIADRIPVDDPAAMVKWFAALTGRQQRLLTQSFRARLFEERAKIEGAAAPGAADVGEADKIEFDRNYKEAASDSDNLRELRRERAFYLFVMQRARARKDWMAESEAAKQFRNFSDVIHDCELRAQRLGHDLGDMVSRSELEQPARFIGYHLLRCADAALKEISAVVADRAALGPITAADVVALAEPHLLRAIVIEPVRRAAEGTNGAAPPPWLVAALRAGVEEVIEKPFTATA